MIFTLTSDLGVNAKTGTRGWVTDTFYDILLVSPNLDFVNIVTLGQLLGGGKETYYGPYYASACAPR